VIGVPAPGTEAGFFLDLDNGEQIVLSHLLNHHASIRVTDYEFFCCHF
jgi:hypothetical protein